MIALSPMVAAYVALGAEMQRAGKLDLAADFYDSARRVLHLERRRGVWCELKRPCRRP